MISSCFFCIGVCSLGAFVELSIKIEVYVVTFFLKSKGGTGACVCVYMCVCVCVCVKGGCSSVVAYL